MIIFLVEFSFFFFSSFCAFYSTSLWQSRVAIHAFIMIMVVHLL